jgi:hypothetical protein
MKLGVFSGEQCSGGALVLGGTGVLLDGGNGVVGATLVVGA